MKTLITRILALSLTLVTLFSVMTVNANAANLSFRDVKQSNWFYKEVMEMTSQGLFKGTTEPVNGVGTFNPQGIMTKEQFMTVLARAFYPDEYASFNYNTLTSADLAPTKNGYKKTNWGVAAQKVLNNHGIGLYMGDLIVEYTMVASNQPISRAWASMLMVQTLEAQNTAEGRDAKNFRMSYKSDFGVDRLWKTMEDGYKRVYGTNFRSDVSAASYEFISGTEGCQGEFGISWTYYAYALGLLNGKSGGWDSSTGTWTPVNLDQQGTLTRAEGATMIYRLLDSSRLIAHPELAAMGIYTTGCTANPNYVPFDTGFAEGYQYWYGLNVLCDLWGYANISWNPSLESSYRTHYGSQSTGAMGLLRGLDADDGIFTTVSSMYVKYDPEHNFVDIYYA